MMAMNLFKVSFMAQHLLVIPLLHLQESRQLLTTVSEGEQGIVGGNQRSFALLCVGSFVLLSYTNQCP
jgi:hypothetical protein